MILVPTLESKSIGILLYACFTLWNGTGRVNKLLTQLWSPGFGIIEFHSVTLWKREQLIFSVLQHDIKEFTGFFSLRDSGEISAIKHLICRDYIVCQTCQVFWKCVYSLPGWCPSIFPITCLEYANPNKHRKMCRTINLKSSFWVWIEDMANFFTSASTNFVLDHQLSPRRLSTSSHHVEFRDLPRRLSAHVEFRDLPCSHIDGHLQPPPHLYHRRRSSDVSHDRHHHHKGVHL